MDMADPSEGCPLSEEAVALFWFLHGDRTAKGMCRRTLSHAQKEFGWSGRHCMALRDELIDGGYIRKDDYGHFEITGDRETPPRPEASLVLALGRPSGRTPGRGQARQLTAKSSSYSQLNVVPYGDSSKSRRDLSRRLVRYSKGIEYQLTDEFCYFVRKHYGGFAPDPINDRAIRGAIRRWINDDGVSPGLVKAMIKVFVSEPQFMRKGVPAWKSFLASRQRLLNLAQDRIQRAAIENDWKRGK